MFLSPISLRGPLHWGRTASGHAIEDGCPCPQEPCGLVSSAQADPTCPQHRADGMPWNVQQCHPAGSCPDLNPSAAAAAFPVPLPHHKAVRLYDDMYLAGCGVLLLRPDGRYTVPTGGYVVPLGAYLTLPAHLVRFERAAAAAAHAAGAVPGADGVAVWTDRRDVVCAAVTAHEDLADARRAGVERGRAVWDVAACRDLVG